MPFPCYLPVRVCWQNAIPAEDSFSPLFSGANESFTLQIPVTYPVPGRRRFRLDCVHRQYNLLNPRELREFAKARAQRGFCRLEVCYGCYVIDVDACVIAAEVQLR